jgi:hypothetical protein
MNRETTLAVDGMLGKLGKYLRAMGFDTLFDPRLGEGIFTRCEIEERVLITTRKSFPEVCNCRVISLEEGPVEKQLAHVVRELGVKPSRKDALTVCLGCNTGTKKVDPAEVVDLVPKNVREKMKEYRRCPSCGKVFWWGSHADRIMELLERSGVYETR